MPLPETATCHFCHKILYGGRSDRRFCNDTCRNAFNREKKKKEAILLNQDDQQRIFKIIRRNYDLLKKHNPLNDDGVIVDRLAIYRQGFNFAYYTSIQQFEGNRIRYFCFEHGWTDLDYGLIELSVDYDKIA